MAVPLDPKIYHITHVDNLPSILASGLIYADTTLAAAGVTVTSIGMGKLKDKRSRRPVRCHPGTMVGDYVPFYFCPRSIMLFTIAQQNHREVRYRGGQEPIVHLEADVRRVVRSASKHGRRWAISLSNAAAAYAEFRDDLDPALQDIRWDYIATNEWGRRPEVKDAKAAEFLVHGSFPWQGIARIGVRSETVRQRVRSLLDGYERPPPVEVRQDWYYPDTGGRHA